MVISAIVKAGRTLPQLYCFPHAGGSASEFSGWAPEGRGFGIVPVHLPGRGLRLGEPAGDDLLALAEQIAAELDVAAPYALFGHSFGALLAYEVVRALQAAGRPAPVCLWLSAFPSPDRYPYADQDVHLLSDQELLRSLNADFGAIPEEVFEYPELTAMVAGQLRSDYRMLAGYRFQRDPVPDCAVHLLAAADDTVDPEELLAWGNHVRVAGVTTTFSGGHFYLRDQENVARLLGLVAQSF
ncbi:alpha/beta fold hydrolase [Kribbella albertanoniae]